MNEDHRENVDSITQLHLLLPRQLVQQLAILHSGTDSTSSQHEHPSLESSPAPSFSSRNNSTLTSHQTCLPLRHKYQWYQIVGQLDFTVTRFLMKLFKSSNVNVIVINESRGIILTFNYRYLVRFWWKEKINLLKNCHVPFVSKVLSEAQWPVGRRWSPFPLFS